MSEMTITSPTGRRFSVTRDGISYRYTITEPDGRTIPHELLGHADCRELISYDLFIEQRNLTSAYACAA